MNGRRLQGTLPDTNADGVAISADGVNWHPVFTPGAQPIGVFWTFVIDLDAAAGMTLGANFKIKFQQFDDFPLAADGRGLDNLAVLTPVVADQDTFTMTLDAGPSFSVAVESDATLQARGQVEAIHPTLPFTGIPVGSAIASAPGLDAVVSNVPVNRFPFGTGTYRVTVSVASGRPPAGGKLMSFSTPRSNSKAILVQRMIRWVRHSPSTRRSSPGGHWPHRAGPASSERQPLPAIVPRPLPLHSRTSATPERPCSKAPTIASST